MASRFKDLDVSVEDFISEQENESTKKKTLQNVAVLQQFLASKKFFITIFLRSILLKSQYVCTWRGVAELTRSLRSLVRSRLSQLVKKNRPHSPTMK